MFGQPSAVQATVEQYSGLASEHLCCLQNSTIAGTLHGLMRIDLAVFKEKANYVDHYGCMGSP